MAGKRLDVHYCVLNTLTRRYGPNQTSDLLGVEYQYRVPPDTEFPKLVFKMDLFTRFFLAGVGPTELAIRIIRHDADSEFLHVVNDYRFVVPFDPAMRVYDHVFRLTQVRLTGTGQYTIQIGRQIRHRWRGLRWRRIGTEFFEVTR
jgi:hypothetical protein